MRTSLLLPERQVIVHNSHGVSPPTDQSVFSNASPPASVKTCLLDSSQLSASDAHSEGRTYNLQTACLVLQNSFIQTPARKITSFSTGTHEDLRLAYLRVQMSPLLFAHCYCSSLFAGKKQLLRFSHKLFTNHNALSSCFI
jgi:hypothetical protein